MLHKEILASTAEHTAALPLPRQDEAAVDLETVAHRPQGVAGCWKFAIQRNSDAISLRTVTDGIRDLNNVHEITDLLAPNDPGKLYSAIERKAAGWAVMDADTRLNDSSAGAGKGARGDHKGAYSATIPCKHFSLRALVLEDTSADPHAKVWLPSPAARATNARSRTAREIGARSVEKSQIRHTGQNRASCVDVNSGFIAT